MSQSASRQTLYALLSAIEDDLRNEISKELSAQVSAKELLGETLWDRAIDRLGRDEDAIAVEPTTDDLLYYCDFGDLVSILNANRAKLPRSASDSLGRITPILERLAPVRNRVAHSRPLQYDDLPTTHDGAEALAATPGMSWSAIQGTLQRLKSEPSFVLGLDIRSYDADPSELRHNLPVPDFDETGFLGRHKQVDELLKIITSSPFPVVSVVGDGGVGKTALVLKTSYDVLDSPSAGFDAVVWTSSKTTRLTPHEVVTIENAISDSVGVIKDVAAQLGADPGAALDEVLSYMAEFKILLVLDNLETVLDDRIKSFLERLPGGSKVLITSRIGLGAFEYPVKLQPLDPGESVQLLRAVSRARGVGQLVAMPNERLATYCHRLKNNPGFIKWFVSVVQTGRRPEDALASPDVFLDFCMSNVYGYLGAGSKRLLRAMLCATGRHSQAELAFLAEMDVLELQRALQQLLTTNLIAMYSQPKGTSFESQYDLTELSRAYLTKHHPATTEEHKTVSRLRRQLVAAGEQLRAQQGDNPFDMKCITTRSRSDLITAKYLVDAITATRKNKFSVAEELVAKARTLAPEYFEVHRVDAYVKARQGNIAAAQTSYEAAIELEPRSAPLRLWYGGFLLIELDDPESALAQFRVADQLRPEIVDIQMYIARANLYLKRFEEAKKSIDALANTPDLSQWARRKVYDVRLQYWARMADFCQTRYDQHGALAALRGLKQAYVECPVESRDPQMKEKLGKALGTAMYCVSRATVAAERDEAQALLEWLRVESGRSKYARGEVVSSPAARQSGVVLRLRKDLGFGFLRCENGRELFFHKNAMSRDAWARLAVGNSVSFVEGVAAKGPCAVDITVGAA